MAAKKSAGTVAPLRRVPALFCAIVRQHSEFGENGVKSGSQLTLNRLFSMFFVMQDFENEYQIILMISDHRHS